MKTVLVTLLVSMNLSLLLPCNGDNPVSGEGKESHPQLRVVSPNDNSAPRQLLVRNHRAWRLTLDWRTSYYRQAHNTPWWPNAPGG